ncbi:hypothetical protein Tco_1156981 [Tanacetum coccineum]
MAKDSHCYDDDDDDECDLPICDDSSPKKDEVLDDIISIPPGNGNDHFNVESSLIESVLNRDNVISSPKIDFLLEEFAGELALIAPIPPGIVEADFDPKGDIRFIENLILEVVEIVIPEVGRIDTDILLTIKDDILHEKFVTNTFDNSLPESETFCFNLEEISSGSPTLFWLYLFLAYEDSFVRIVCPITGNFTMDVVDDIFDNLTREPRVHVPTVLPTHPTLQLDSDFTLSSNSLGSDLVVSFPSETRNKIFRIGVIQ